MSNALPNSPGGYFTNGMQTADGSQLSANSRVPVDTGLAGGESPQAGGIIPGTQILFGSAITATPGGTKAAAVQIGYGVNRISVCATATNSVLLPYAYPGAVCIIDNDGATAAQVFGKGTDTVDSVNTATGVALTNAQRGILYGYAGSGDGSDAGAWFSVMGGKIS